MLCSVMSVVAKSGDVKGTEALMLEAEATFPIITPHFNCCLDACHVAGDADSAFRILEEMQAASCRPDVISYNSSLGALDRAGRGKEDRDRLLQEMAKNEVKPNELFVDRHICSVLGIQKGAQVSAEWISRLPEEAPTRRFCAGTRRSLLGANVSQSTDESSNESGAKRSAEALGGAATDWVKVLGKDEAGSIIEYFWDRSSAEEPARRALPAAFTALRASDLAELSAAVSDPQVCMQYQMDSRHASSMASVLTCAVMIASREPRPPAHLWEVDWQALGKELEPPQAFTEKLKDAAFQLMTRGGPGEGDQEMHRALWREMNRTPQVWSGPEAVANLGREPCELQGLARLRQCVMAFAHLASPEPESVLAAELQAAEERQRLKVQELQEALQANTEASGAEELQALQRRLQELALKCSHLELQCQDEGSSLEGLKEEEEQAQEALRRGVGGLGLPPLPGPSLGASRDDAQLLRDRSGVTGETVPWWSCVKSLHVATS
eukprot:g1848.t1